MDELHKLAGEVAERILSKHSVKSVRGSRLFQDMQELAAQMLRETRSWKWKATDLLPDRRMAL